MSSDAPPKASILALARAEFDRVDLLYRYRLLAHLGTLGAGASAVVLPEPLAYILSVVAGFTEVCALVLRVSAARGQAHASEALRRAQLIDAFGERLDPLDLAETRAHFPEGIEKRATEDPAFYSSAGEKGRDRLVADLQESAFFSKHLYRAAANRGLVLWLTIVAGVATVGIFALPHFSQNLALTFARTVALFLAFASTADGITRVLDWYHAAAQSEQVDRRLESIRSDIWEYVIAVFADYAAITAAAPTIPNSVYKAKRAPLNALWSERSNLRAGRQLPSSLPRGIGADATDQAKEPQRAKPS